MNRRQRVEAAVGGQPVDRVPVGAWDHFFTRECTAEDLADTMIGFRAEYDWDYLKIHARASYHVEGWGYAFEPSPDLARGHVCTGTPIREAADWRKLRPLGLDDPALAEQIRLIELIRAGVPADVPLIMTVFLPLDVAEKLADRDGGLLKRHMAEDPEAVRFAFGVFADTFAAFVRRVVEAGVDGIYFSTKWANDNKLPAETYRDLAGEHDLRVMNEARGLWCNFLHVCEDAVQLAALADYPAAVVHWDTHTDHNPDFAAARRDLGATRALGGGVDAATLAAGSPDDVLGKGVDAIRQTGGRGFLLGPGCSVQVARTSVDNLRALRRAPEVAAQ